MKKRIAQRARLDLVYYAAAPAKQDIECEVQMEGKGIRIAAPGLSMLIHGPRVGPGHFMVMGSDGRIGSLHRFPTGQTFVGQWRQCGNSGFWRIRLTRPESSGDSSRQIEWLVYSAVRNVGYRRSLKE